MNCSLFDRRKLHGLSIKNRLCSKFRQQWWRFVKNFSQRFTASTKTNGTCKQQYKVRCCLRNRERDIAHLPKISPFPALELGAIRLEDVSRWKCIYIPVLEDGDDRPPPRGDSRARTKSAHFPAVVMYSYHSYFNPGHYTTHPRLYFSSLFFVVFSIILWYVKSAVWLSRRCYIIPVK